MSEALPVTPSFRLDGKRALVTGGSRGIGRAAAAALAAAGADVLLIARDPADLEEARSAITAAGGTCEALPLDVTDLEAFAAAIEDSSAIDVFVNNAGTNRPSPFAEVRTEDFDLVVGVNLRAAFFCAQAIARSMVQTGTKGSIINMSSQMGHVGGRNRTVYCATKHALEGLTKAMALDLAENGIRVNSICPTFIETPMTKPFFEKPEFAADTLSRIPLGRIGHVDDVMGSVVFLASDASALMTGASLMVDGGWTAQ